MSKKQVLFISETGWMHTIEPSMAQMFSLRRQRRFSYIEPANRHLRALFQWIRARVDDDSLVAAWTRLWPVLWRVRLASTGQILGVYWTRRAAIRGEKAYHTTGQWIPGYFPTSCEDDQQPKRQSTQDFSGW